MKTSSAFSRLFRQGRAAVLAVVITHLLIVTGYAACISDPVRITTAPEASLVSPSPMAWSGNDYGVAWFDQRASVPGDLYFTRLQDDGTRLVADQPLTTPPVELGVGSVYVLVWSGSRYALLWADTRSTPTELYYSILDRAGNKIVPDTATGFTGLFGSGYFLRGVWAGDRFVFSFPTTEFARPSGLGFLAIDSDGVILAGPRVIQRFPVPEAIQEGHAVVWTESDVVFVWTTNIGVGREGRFLKTDRDGNVLLGPTTWSTTNPLNLLSAVWTGSEVIAAFMDEFTADGLKLASLDTSGVKTGPDILIEDSASFPGGSSLSYDGRFVGVTYTAAVNSIKGASGFRVGNFQGLGVEIESSEMEVDCDPESIPVAVAVGAPLE